MSESTSAINLDHDCDLTGTLTLKGDVTLLGRFDGTLRIAGTLHVGPEAVVRGRVHADELHIARGADFQAEAILTRPEPAMSYDPQPVAAESPPGPAQGDPPTVATVPDVLHHVLGRRRTRVLSMKREA